MKVSGAIVLGALLIGMPLWAAGESWSVGTGSSQTESNGESHHNLGRNESSGYDNGGDNNAGNSNGYGDGNDNGYSHGGANVSSGFRADAIVDLPPEVWSRGQNNNQHPCLRCCSYQDRSYTEGSVVRMEGILLQCARDEKSWGTNNLTWQRIK